MSDFPEYYKKSLFEVKKGHFELVKEKEFVDIINKEYARAKKLSKPLLNGKNRSFVRFVWNLKAREHNGGTCWSIMNTIAMNVKFRDVGTGKWDRNQFVLMIRHEISHLANPDRGHGVRFLNILKVLEGHRYLGYPVYDGTKKTR